MKIIDLLNKIANGEHNFKFKYCDLEYFWDFSSKAFIDTESKMTIGERWEIDNILNDEIEEIEEDKKIKTLDLDWVDVFKLKEQAQKDCAKMVFNKINEIIDILNKE